MRFLSLFFATLLLGFTNVVFGQLHVGLKLGYSPYATIQGLENLVNYNTARFKYVENVSNSGLTREDGLIGNKNLSLHASVNYGLGKYFQANAELAYMQTGGKIVYRANKDVAPNINTTYLPLQSIAQLNYINLPATFRFSFGLDSTILKLFVEAGGYAGLLVGKYSSQPPFTYYIESGEVKKYPMVGGTVANSTWLANENFSSLDFGLVFGGGAQIDLGKGKVEVSAKYMYGLADIWGGSGNVVLNNRFLNFSVGYLINLSGSKSEANQFAPASEPTPSSP